MNKGKNIKKILLVLSANSLIATIGFASFAIIGSKETSVAANLDVNTKPVCYISGYSHIYYSSIEAALLAAEKDTANNTIYVIPNLGFDINIISDCTIDNGDTLCLPYEGTTWESNRNNQANNFADANQTNVNNYRKTRVVVDDGVTIVNKGTIQIGGVLGVGESSQRPTGLTVGKYAEIVLGSESSIQNEGTIYCYGYIKESTLNNDSSVNNKKNSYLYMPFVIYDFKGGGYSGSANKEGVFPFNVFDLPNIQTKLDLNCNSQLLGVATAYANKAYQTPDPIVIVGYDAGLFRLTNGNITLKYTSSNWPYTTNDSLSTTTSETANITKLIVNGDMSLASLSINIGIDVNTSDFYCPISYKYDIEIQTGTVNIQNTMKFLSGSKLLVEENAILNFNAGTMFYQNYVDDCEYLANKYPDSLGSAVLINNGTLNINSNFSGFIDTNNSGAITNVASNISLSTTLSEMIMVEDVGWLVPRYDYDYQKITGYGVGIINDEDLEPTSSDIYQFLNGNSYVSMGHWWKGSKGNGPMAVTESTTSTGSGTFCILPGTLITMFDGSYKKVEDVKQGDLVLVFNHWTGKYDISPVLFNDAEKPANVDVINLEFSDGTTIGVVSEHGFFDLDLNEYVYINQRNYHKYLGHKFYLMNDLQNPRNYKAVALIKEYVTVKNTAVYSIVTYKHLNSFNNGLLSMPGGIEGLFNIFDLDNNMMVDKAKMKSDIEKYGIFAYDYFKNSISKEEFEAYNGKYLKVALGKGILTKEKLNELINRYAGKFETD